METSFLINLLLEVQEYEHSKSFKNHATIEDFRIWLNEKKYTTESPTKLFKNENHEVSFTENEICKQENMFFEREKLFRKIICFSYSLSYNPPRFTYQFSPHGRYSHRRDTGNYITKI